MLLAVPSRGKAYLTPEERRKLQLDFTVTNRDESYFDVVGRMALIRRTDDPQIVQQRDKLAMGLSCRRTKRQPVLDGELALPSYYENPDEWALTVEPLFAFERSMSDLAGAWVASGDPYYADCLVDVLERWAKEEAFYRFRFSPARPQTWFAIESMIFAAALAFSTITGNIEIAPTRRESIENWMMKIALRHFNTHLSWPSCCNNHYYRRALYMTMVGVVAGNDKLFRTGLRSVYSALDDLTPGGAFALSLRRGWRAIHYQNHSLLYLVTIMQIARRQGYDLFNLKVNGLGFEDAVSFLMRSLENPDHVEGLPEGEQDLEFTNDGQFFSWMEIWLSHFENPSMSRFLNHLRPIFNRSAGGYLTLYFKEPETPLTAIKRDLVDLDTARMSEAELGARYPILEKWRRSR
jgi:poly(beta-D-mannuronate) lyase